MKLRPVYLLIAAVSILGAACSSSSSSSGPMSGTETISAVVSGSEAASQLNSNSNAPLTFPTGTWTGVVATSISPFTLGGGPASSGFGHWATPEGTNTVYHVAGAGYTNPNAPPPASATKWVKNGTDCSLTVMFSKGFYFLVPDMSTGKFATLDGEGAYSVVAQGIAPLKSGDSTKPCSFATIGPFGNDGAKITFNASGPVLQGPSPSPTS
jgi:hypothetical protein